jgi:outer membrane cobalamin receptor
MLAAWGGVLLLGAAFPLATAGPLVGSLGGRLADPRTGAPVAGVRVALDLLGEEGGPSVRPASSRSTRGHVTWTDATGTYRFEDLPPGIYRLAFTGGKYAGRSISGIRVVAGMERRVDADPGPGLSERVTVLGGIDGGGLSRVALGSDDLDSRPAALQDPFRALAGRAGISQESDFKSEMRIRGGEATDTAVLMDGQPLPYAYHFGGSAGSAGTLSADVVDEVQVHTGGFSVEYGDALAGVIDIASRARRPASISGTAGVGSLLAHAALSGPAGEGSWVVSGRMSDMGLYDRRVSTDQVQGVQFHDLFASIRQPLPGQARLEAVLLEAGNRFDAGAGDGGRAAMSSRSRGGRFRIEAPVNDRTLWRVQLADGALSVESSVTDGVSFDQDQGKQEVAVSVLRLLGADHRLNGGACLERTQGDMSGTVSDGAGLVEGDPRYDAARVGAFLEDTWRPGERVSLRYGLRADRSSETGSGALSPRASLELRPLPGLALSFAAGRFVQFPRQEQVYLAAGESLRPQVADHLILGMERSFATGLRIVVEGYRKELKDPIGEAVNRYVELPERTTRFDRGRIRGGEVTLDQASGGAWRFGFNYGYMVATLEKNGRESSANADQRHNASLFLATRFGRGWSAAGTFRYASGFAYSPLTPVTVGFNHGIGVGELNGHRLPACHRLDLRVSRWIPVSWGRLGVQIDLLNVYNRANVRSVDLYYDEAEHAYFRATYYQSPFLPIVAMSAEF